MSKIYDAEPFGEKNRMEKTNTKALDSKAKKKKRKPNEKFPFDSLLS